MKCLKNSTVLSTLLFGIACVFLFYFGYRYITIPNIYIPIFACVYILLSSIVVGYIRFDINYCFLIEFLIIKAVLDQQIGKVDLVSTTMAIPILMYMFGKLVVATPIDSNLAPKLSDQLKAIISMVALASGMTAFGFRNLKISSSHSIYFYYNYIVEISIFLAGVIWLGNIVMDKNRLSKRIKSGIFWDICLLLVFLSIRSYISTDRFMAFKEGVHLIVHKHWGNFGLDLSYDNSTSNMWLDYGRDYGILVFIPLGIYFILTVIDLVMLLLNDYVGIFVKSVLILSFIGFNIFYFIDGTAYIYPQFWYIGLFVCGVVSEISHVYRKKTNREET